jgi:23S rRNA (pseudouridine1915-N3)-methyltransferase
VKDRALREKLDEYSRRIRFEAQLEIVSVRDSGRESEGVRLLQALERFKRARVYALSETGRQFSSEEFAGRLRQADGDVVFVLGGPDGLATAVVERADAVLSLSAMTFPHEMALVMLSEQIFRALTILGGRSYHKR